MRLFIDANIYISYLLPTKNFTIVKLIKEVTDNHTILTSKNVIYEIKDKFFNKRYLRQKIRKEMLADFIAAIENSAEFIPPVKYIPPASRDPKDDYLLAYALAGRADYLVTGDEDLFEMKEYKGVRIVSPGQMLKKLKILKKGIIE